MTPWSAAICLYERLLFNLRDNAFDLSTLGLVGLFVAFMDSAVIVGLSVCIRCRAVPALLPALQLDTGQSRKDEVI